MVIVRKVYKQPSAVFVEIGLSGSLAVSGETEGTGSAIGSGTVDPGDAWAGEARGDWSDIWNGM